MVVPCHSYTEEGMQVDIELEKLGKISEMWERVPKETGWFKYEDGENLEEFGKAAGENGGEFLKEFIISTALTLLTGWGEDMGEKLKCYKLFQVKSLKFI